MMLEIHSNKSKKFVAEIQLQSYFIFFPKNVIDNSPKIFMIDEVTS